MASQQGNDSTRQAKLDRLCIEHAAIAIYRISEKDGQILSVNQQACRDLGYTEDELHAMTIFDLDPNFAGPSKEKWLQHRNKVSQKGSGTIETLHRRKDGSLMHVEVTVTYMEFEGEKISFSFARDITKRKQTEEALRQSEKLFRTTLYSIGDAVITCDLNGKVLQLNAIAEELTDWKEEEARGHPIHTIFKIINEYTREPVESPADKVFEQGKIVGLANHTLLVSRKGRETPIADSGAPIFSDEGHITGVVLVFRDQTEEKQHQQELEQSRNYLSTLLNNLPGMAFRCLNNPSWDMEYISKGCEELTGYTPGELMKGRPIVFGEVIHPDDREWVWEQVQQAIEDQSPYQFEYRIVTKNKMTKWVWEQGEAILSKSGTVEALEGFISDISDRKHYEKKLKENDRLKTAFLQNVSHEIRTPLNAVIGFSELIRENSITKEERNEYIDIVQSSGHKLLGILNNVLELSRIETGDTVLEKSEFALNQFMEGMLNFFRPHAQSKNLEIKFSPESDQDISINTDHSKLDQIMTNLINNAIKYTDQGTIEFGYTRQNADLIFFVKDTGPGLSQEQQARVFDRFYRTENRDAQLQEGVGLGLSICLELIELLNGQIWVESEPGKGTRFYFSLRQAHP